MIPAQQFAKDLLCRHFDRLVRQGVRQMGQHLFRTDLNEVHPLRRPVRQYVGAVATVRLGHMRLYQGAQLCVPMRMGNRAGDQGFKVHEIFGDAFGIIDIGHATGHACAKVGPDPAQNHRHTARHVFATV